MMSDEIEVAAADGHVVRATHRAVDAARAAILLIHGITADRTEWGYYALLGDALQGRGIASLAIDYRGHGKSAMTVNELMLSGVMLDIDASWRYLAAAYPDGARRIIAGNSFGGGVAYLYGMATPSVDHVFLTMPVLSYVDDVSRVNAQWAADAAIGGIPYASLVLPALIAPELFFFDALIERVPGSKEYIILHGRADTDVPFTASEEFHRAHPHGQLFGLDEMDHCWAAPWDPERQTAQSRANQERATERSVELLEGLLPA